MITNNISISNNDSNYEIISKRYCLEKERINNKLKILNIRKELEKINNISDKTDIKRLEKILAITIAIKELESEFK